MKKRLLSLILVVCMVLSVAVTTVAQEKTPCFSYSITTKEVNGTEYVLVTPNLSDNIGFASLDIELSFDTDKLSVASAVVPSEEIGPLGKFQTGTDIRTGNPTYSSAMSIFNTDQSGIDISKLSLVKLVATTGTNVSKDSGKLFEAYFAVKKGYKAEDIKLTDFRLNVNLYADSDGKRLEYTVNNYSEGTDDATAPPTQVPTAEPTSVPTDAPVVEPIQPPATEGGLPTQDKMQEGYYTYTVTDGKATITACDKSISGDVTIPSTLGGYPVTEIGKSSFSGCDNIDDLIIPDSVTVIADSAFEGIPLNFGGPRTVTIGKGVTTIGEKAFACCRNTIIITINSDKLKTIGKYAFWASDFLKKVNIPDSVTELGECAFLGCNNLRYINIPQSITVIEQGVFKDCLALKSITVPQGVTAIDNDAFKNCRSLRIMNMPASVKSIGELAFLNSDRLIEINYQGTKEEWNSIDKHEMNELPRNIIYESKGRKNPFSDVAEDTWFRNDIDIAYNYRFIDGKSETEYMPFDNITYAETIKLASSLNKFFYDDGYAIVRQGDEAWFAPYMEYALKNNIIEKDLTDVANEKITRYDFVKIFYKALPESEYKEINEVIENKIPDVKADNELAKEVYAFYRAGILTGSDDAGTFMGESNITRAEVAAILTRMFDNNARKSITLN